MMIALVPAALMAADSGEAMLRPYGAAWVNGTAVEQPATIFSGDLVQTGAKSALKIRSTGSSVTVLAESLVNFAGGSVQVQHGSVRLATSKSMFASAGMITATPASNAWTEFEFAHVGDTVQIIAVKGDLLIGDGTQTTTLPQGQQSTQKDSSDTPAKPDEPVPPAKKKKKKAAVIVLVAAGAGAAATAAAVAVALNSAGAPRTISPVTP